MNLRRALLALALVSVSSSALAATATDQFDVTIQVKNKCVITASDIDFGSADDLGTALNSTGTVNVKCNHKGGAYAVSFDLGAGIGATAAARKMTELGGDTVDYGLYSDVARSVALGGAATLAGDSTLNRDKNFTVYARVFGGQNGKTVGDYADTVTATVTY